MYYFCVDMSDMMDIMGVILKTMIILLVVLGSIGFFGIIYYSLRMLFAVGESILDDFKRMNKDERKN